MQSNGPLRASNDFYCLETLTTLTILTALDILETCKAQVLFPDVPPNCA